MTSLNRTILTVVLAAVSLTAVPAAGAAVPKDFVGIDSQDTFQHAFNNDLGSLDGNLTAQKKIGVRIHRQQFSWETIETKRGSYDFTITDRYMGRMAMGGMRILPVLFNAPAFHAKKPDKPAQGIFSPPKNGKVLGQFGAAIIRRYGPSGTFWTGAMARYKKTSAIRALQAWNEPNLRFYWGGKPNAKQYVSMLKGFYQEIKRAHRSIEIVTAGIPDSTTAKSIPLRKYIQQMYKAGAKKWFDTFGLNAYARNVADLGLKIAAVREEMKRAGDAKAKVWITEIGWADTGNKHYLVKGAAGQAKEITKAIALMGKQRKKSRIRGFIYYQWRDAPPNRSGIDPGTWGFHAGLIRENGTAKRAHNAFKKAVAKL